MSGEKNVVSSYESDTPPLTLTTSSSYGKLSSRIRTIAIGE